METRRTFDTQAGIEVQTEQLKKWELVLKPEVFAELQKFATKDNGKAKTGYDIVRGVQLDGWVKTYSYVRYSL